MTREMVKIYHVDGEEVSTYSPASELKEAVEHTNMVPMCIYKNREHGYLELPKEEIIGESALYFADGKIKADCYFDLEKMNPEQLKILDNLEKDNLSPAFKTVTVKKSGSFQGVHYDEIQTQIRFYHVAVVTQGRCSSKHGCGLYRDTFDAIYIEDSAELDKCRSSLINKGHSEDVAYGLCQDVLMREEKINLPIYATDADIKDNTTTGTTKSDSKMATDEEMKLLQEQLDKAKTQNDAYKALEKQALIKQVHDAWKIPVEELDQKSIEVLTELSKLKPPTGKPGQDVSDSTAAPSPRKTPAQRREELDQALMDSETMQLDSPDYRPGVTILGKKSINTVLDDAPRRIFYDNKTGKKELLKDYDIISETPAE